MAVAGIVEPVMVCWGADNANGVFTSADNPIPFTEVPTTTNGTSLSTWKSDGTDYRNVPKASAGKLFSITAFNVNAAAAYLKLYNLAADPTVASDTPVARFVIPGATTGAGFVLRFEGASFSTGIAFAVTTAVADNSVAAPASNEVFINVEYK